MTFNEFGTLVKAMRTYFPKEKILETKESIELWYEELKDLDYQMATAELRKYVALNKFPPTITDIRRCLIDFAESKELNESQAWELVIATISEVERGGLATKRFEALPAIVQEAVGGRTQFLELVSSRISRGAVRQSFVKAYAKLLEKDIEIRMLQPEIRQCIESATARIESDPISEIEDKSNEELIEDGWEEL